MALTINFTVVKDLEYRVFTYLDTYCSGTFDNRHIKLVAKHCKELAEIRGLDPDVARTIGLLHDHGRVIGQVYGKGHGEAGKEIARQWLAPYQVSEEVLQIITMAIGNHSYKKRMDGPYDELIKDADCLAHEDEFGEVISKYERVRIEDARLAPLIMALNDDKDLQKTLDKGLKKLNRHMKGLSKSGLTNKGVHQYRVQVRRIRALLWLGDEDGVTGKGKALNKCLKASFKDHGYVRQLAVFNRTLKRLSISKSIRKIIEKDMVINRRKVAKAIVGHRQSIGKAKIPKVSVRDEQLSTKLEDYRDKLRAADVRDMKGLHELRISGKKLKYLIEEGVVLVSEVKDYDRINDLHETIGQINDIYENRRLLPELLKEKKYQKLATYENTLRLSMEGEEKGLKKELKVLLLRSKKRWL